MKKRKSSSVQMRSPTTKKPRTNNGRNTEPAPRQSKCRQKDSNRQVQACRKGQQQQQHRRASRQRSCVCLADNYVPIQFPGVWSELRSNQQLCDGTIKCGEKSTVFPVHRAILSAVSPYFRALFTSTLNPLGKPEAIRELSISDAPADVFALVLNYAYTGSCRVNADNVQQLLPLADRLQVLGVVQLCCRFLLNELKPDNCLGIYNFAKHYFCRDLEQRGRNYIRQNFRDIIQTSIEFKDLTYAELEQILRDDDLNARTEELVFEAIKTWVDSQPDNRAVHVPKLLTCVRYGLMRPRYFFEKIVTWNLAQTKECKETLDPVAAYFEDRTTNPDSYSELEGEMSRPRVPHEILFAIGGWSYGAPTNFVETYDTRADRWYLCPHLDSTPRSYHGMCSLNNQIYVIGGRLGYKYFNTVRCFDPVCKEWHEKACMYHARSYVSICTHGGKIYALGGNNGTTRMSSCERYDPKTNQWELIAHMNWPRSDASSDSLDGRIYVVGGYDGQYILQSFEVYDVETNQWSYLMPLRIPRSGVSLVAFKDCLYAIGGFNGYERLSTFYDVETNQWSYLMPLRIPRSGVSLVAFKDCLYAIGGFNGYERLSTCEKYNPKQGDEWQEMTEMFNPRSNFATAVLDDLIFVIGGYDDTTPVACVECYDIETNEWYEASSMILRRSGLKACVVSGLENSREYSYHRDYPELWPKQTKKQKRFRRVS